MEYIFLFIIVVQWLFLGWYIYGARVERKRLTDDIINMRPATHTLHEYAPEITMPHPDTGALLRFQHSGNGKYVPNGTSNIHNNVADVEGVMQ